MSMSFCLFGEIASCIFIFIKPSHSEMQGQTQERVCGSLTLDLQYLATPRIQGVLILPNLIHLISDILAHNPDVGQRVSSNVA